MEHTFETVEQADFDAPPPLASWLYVAGFTNMLPDRLNAGILRTKASQQSFGRHVLVVTESPEGDHPDVVKAVHFLLEPGQPAAAAWLSEQLDIIERDGILDEELYWPLVDPILQQLWEEASPGERARLCAAGEDAPLLIHQESVPPGAHAILYEQISD